MGAMREHNRFGVNGSHEQSLDPIDLLEPRERRSRDASGACYYSGVNRISQTSNVFTVDAIGRGSCF